MQNLEKLDSVIEPMLRAARIPGAAIAIVADGKTIFSKGSGYRDLEAGLAVTADTVYPIASTTKAINATLIGMLVDEGRLAWDTPVQNYLPSFRLIDPLISTQVTLRDLLAMRTGLPRHDWVWIESPMSRADLVGCLRHLELSAGFRERFQYSNMTATAAGFIAETVMGRSWEDLVKERILDPLEMDNTRFAQPDKGPVTLSYHENSQREIKLSERLTGEVTAPSGGAIHSTVEDMARWMLFNLNGGTVQGRELIKTRTLAEIHAPQVVARTDPSCPTPHASYAMGWFVDTYNGRPRLSHGGYLHDVNSEVMLFPQDGIGIVSFTNFGFPALARLINQHAFDLLMGFSTVQRAEEKLAQYEEKISATRERNDAVRRVANTSPSHSLEDYAGLYAHPGYGKFAIQCSGEELVCRRNNLVIPLEHWHYDVWIARDIGRFYLHAPHPFDRASRILFETNADGAIASLSIRLEPDVAAIRFEKQQAPGE